MKTECKHINKVGHDTGIFTYVMCTDCGQTLEIRDTERVNVWKLSGIIM